MGIGPSDIRLIAKLGAAGHIAARSAIIEIGAQHLSDNALQEGDDLIATLRSSFGIAEPTPFRLPPSGSRATVEGGRQAHHLAEPLWSALGFEYASIDLDGSPGSIPLDLNFDSVAAADRGRFALTTNFGTTEHLINQFNAMKVIHDLTAPRGVMVHNLPGYGYVTHGFFVYHPRFFMRLARANKYKVLHLDFRIANPGYGLKPGLIGAIAPFDETIHDRAATYQINDGAVQVALKKTSDAEFLAPLDVPDWADFDNAPWMARYRDPPPRPPQGFFARLFSRRR